MLHTQTVEAGTLALIKKLMDDSNLNEFNLVGGTALSLKLGHRLSIDIDLFSTTSFNAPELTSYLKENYNAAIENAISNGIFCFIDKVKVDLISHQYPLVGKIDVEEGIRMVSLTDIGAMKLNAIHGNGTRLKDFVDMYILLEHFSLNEMLQACNQKYPDLNIQMVHKSLIHHADIDFPDRIRYIGPTVKWARINDRLKKAFYNPHLTFGLPEITKKLMQKKDDTNIKRKRRL